MIKVPSKHYTFHTKHEQTHNNNNNTNTSTLL